MVKKFSYQETMKKNNCGLLSIALNHSITEMLFLHRLRLVFCELFPLISILLLTFPISDFDELTNLKFGLSGKFSFWSLIVV